MGKGDIKTAKGKRVNGSYGNSRKRKSTATATVVAPKAKKEVKEKAAPKKEVKEVKAKAPAVKKETVAKPKAAAKPKAEKKTTEKEA